MGKDLHPSIQEFKQFVERHPDLIKEVRKSGKGWQPHYEKWILLGEDDPSWEKYKSNSTQKRPGQKKKESKAKGSSQEKLNKLMKMVENVDLDKMEGHINQLNGAVGNIQKLFGQFQDAKRQFSGKSTHHMPFHRRRD
ncbi:YlbD family protein [Radiobacillus kanasensis]|uniref:YlbD family protein n=1 Tax=Radiobacillus kanasensis TaxID=2844358 RepID=UPI001E60B2BA|nr:YlbD family protein [Radiobacillus kanasensis]UFU00915.1 YlbD family protein [Radiobacillus kanasensis]